MTMIDVFGTLGPACEDEETLTEMFAEGMTGMRINLSHVMLKDCVSKIEIIKRAAAKNNVMPKILIDMQGPEIRIGDLREPVELREGATAFLGKDGIPVSQIVLDAITSGQQILLDDGKILAEAVSVHGDIAEIKIVRGGLLSGRKSLALIGTDLDTPALTEDDISNIKIAAECGVTGVMQPFVRSADDLNKLRSVLNEYGGEKIRIYAKIENMKGVDNLKDFFLVADEIVIARGDLGNAMPLWELPRVQKQISKICNEHKIPFMVVTQMLASMENSQVPTRAEVNDIYNAVLDGASSVMVTGETAVGRYPVEVIRYLSQTAKC
ncbi:pyruvate kinase [Butyrivibrio sp. MC2021]|uniref:pyruvate kinase n=1 Tax=Butyrivibrio sp. MC2021 TaxID=1408306 RepID=UPI00047D3460|nr:pyruvate kinase [Butyrivibrio sp. MC2021]